MYTIGPEAAVDQIVRTWRNAKKEEEPNPFVFVVGAGISYPSIPLAADIKKNCQRLAPESEDKTSTRSRRGQSPLEEYSFWLKEAFPQPRERQDYIKELIEHKPISASNLRLAHLLLEGLANIVITPNFDDFLSRALRLFGRNDFRLCDRSATADRIRPESRAIQIVHVHGTYHFYDISNLKGEIEGVANEDGAFSIRRLLEDIFKVRSPIVIGYSGWKGDVIMSAMEKCMSGRRLEHNLYWFCYSADEVGAITDWRAKHENVVVVDPSHCPGFKKGKGKETTRGKPTCYLPSLSVFDEFVRSLKLEPPLLVSDPFRFLSNQVEEALGTRADSLRGSSNGDGDPYSFESVVHRIRYARTTADQDWLRTKAKLEAVRNSVRASLYRTAKSNARQIDVEALELRELQELNMLMTLSIKNAGEELEDQELLRSITNRIDEIELSDATGIY